MFTHEKRIELHLERNLEVSFSGFPFTVTKMPETHYDVGKFRNG